MEKTNSADIVNNSWHFLKHTSLFYISMHNTSQDDHINQQISALELGFLTWRFWQEVAKRVQIRDVITQKLVWWPLIFFAQICSDKHEYHTRKIIENPVE